MDVDSAPQNFSLGIKELWEVPKGTIEPGFLKHTLGWPLDDSYGGGFLYAMSETQIQIGYIVGLDYKDPYTSPYEEFQLWKTHPQISKYLTKG